MGGRVCRYCGEAIELVGRRQWVTVLSGDDGGTYDICEQNWGPDDQDRCDNGGHRPAKLPTYEAIMARHLR